MKKRIIVAVIAIPVLLAVIFFAPVWVLAALVGAIAAGAAWELLRCISPEEPLRRKVESCACAFLIPALTAFFPADSVRFIMIFALFALLMCELMLSFRSGEPIPLSAVTNGLLSGGVMPVLLSAIVVLAARENGRVYVLLPFVAAFSSDSGAYFAGTALGKHKITPHLSPNKSMEGCVGGFLSAIVLMLVYAAVLSAVGYQVNYAVMAVYGFLGSLACQLGDLSFSAIKRLYGVKDYGDLIPGHGGVLDRFDSMFWTAAMVCILVKWVPAIQ